VNDEKVRQDILKLRTDLAGYYAGEKGKVAAIIIDLPRRSRGYVAIISRNPDVARPQPIEDQETVEQPEAAEADAEISRQEPKHLNWLLISGVVLVVLVLAAWLAVWARDPIRRAEALRLRFRYPEAEAVLREARDDVDKARERSRWLDLTERLAQAELEEGDFGPADRSRPSIEAAARDYTRLLGELTSDSDTLERALAQTGLAATLMRQAERGKVLPDDASTPAEATVWLTQAADICAQALRQYPDVVSRQGDLARRKAKLWAATQTAFGNILFWQAEQAAQVLEQRQTALQLLSQAQNAYSQAKNVRTRSDDLEGWANTQLGLANTLLRKAELENSAADIQPAIAEYRDIAGAVQNRFPKEWAMAQDGLGNALRSKGLASAEENRQGEATNLFAEAANAHRAAAQTLPFTSQYWARAEENLGFTLYMDGESRTDAPEISVLFARGSDAYRAALQVYTKNDLKQDFARTVTRLGMLQAGQNDWPAAAQSLEQAIEIVPNYDANLVRLEDIYHNHLFAFEKSYHLAQRLLALDRNSTDWQLNLAEEELTTLRFTECAGRLGKLSASKLSAQQSATVGLLLFTCEYGAGRGSASPASLRSLLDMASELPALDADFSGTKYFLTNTLPFAKSGEAWPALFQHFIERNGAKMTADLHQIQNTR
jgi:hypothetical protein